MAKIEENTRLIEKKHRLLREIEEIEQKIAENLSKKRFELERGVSPKSSKTSSGKTIKRGKSSNKTGQDSKRKRK